MYTTGKFKCSGKKRACTPKLQLLFLVPAAALPTSASDPYVRWHFGIFYFTDGSSYAHYTKTPQKKRGRQLTLPVKPPLSPGRPLTGPRLPPPRLSCSGGRGAWYPMCDVSRGEKDKVMAMALTRRVPLGAAVAVVSGEGERPYSYAVSSSSFLLSFPLCSSVFSSVFRL